MKKINLTIFILAGVLMILMPSCIGMKTQKSLRTTTMMPDRVELRLELDDFEYLGDTTVTIAYNRYFGFIKVLREINGKDVSRRNVVTVQTHGRSWMPFWAFGEYINRALYDAKQAIPDGEIFIPVMITTETNNMFLGRKVIKTIEVRAYRLKTY